MKVKKIIVGRKDGTIEKHIIRYPKNGNLTNAIIRYGAALQDAYGDIAGITYGRGYAWVGHTGNIDVCPALYDWSNALRSELDPVTWGTL